MPGKATHLDCGQHGGLARYEQMPFLMIAGAGFTAGAAFTAPTSPIDIAPTILAHLGCRRRHGWAGVAGGLGCNSDVAKCQRRAQ